MKKLLLVPLFGLIGLSAFAQCPPTAPLSTPLTVDFENESTFTSSGSNTLANCWIAGAAGSSVSANWKVDIAGTPSGLTGPSIDNTLGTSAGKYLFLESSYGTAGDSIFFTSPDIDITTLTTPQVSFFYHKYGATMGDLIIDVYDGTSWTYNLMTISGQTHTSSGQAYAYTAISLSSFSNDTIQIRFKGIKGTSYTGDMAIDDIKVENAPACPFAINLLADQVQPYQANLHWGSVTAASTYSVIYGITGFDPASAGTTVNNIAADSLQVTSLIAASDYDFYVIANCGTNGLSDTAGPGKFATACAAKATPFTENFDGVSTGNSVNPSLPNCWDYVETPFAGGYAYTFTTSYAPAYSLPNMFRMYNSNNASTPLDTMFLVSPEVLGLDSGTKQITFYAKPGNTSSAHQVKVGTVNNSGDISSFNLIATVTLNATVLQFDEFIVLLDSSSGNNLGHTRIALMHGNNKNFQNIYLDDIIIEDIPPCPKPVSFVLDFVASDSVGIAWSGTGVKYNGEYGLTGFTQGTGTFFTPLQNSDTLFGLVGNTYYDVYLQNDCQSSNNGTSIWAGPFTFKTLCIPLTGSFTENFDATVGSTSSNNKMPDCWSYYETPNSGGYGYILSSSSFARSPTQMLWLFNGFTNNAGDTIMAISPQFTDMPTANKQLRLWYKATSSFSPDQLIIGTVASPDDPGSLVIIDTLPAATTIWTEYLTRIDASNGYNGTHEYIVLMHANNSGNFKTLIVDDVSFEPIPSCISPTGIAASNVTQAGALITWTPGGGSVFEVEYGGIGFGQGTGTVTTGITDSSLVLTGLTAQTCYDVYVRDSCSGGSYSPWTGPFTFCTPCSAKVTPLTENFDNATVGSFINRTVPDCWASFQTGNAYSYVYTSTWTPANSTPNMFRMYNSNSFTTGDTVILISPEIIALDSADKMIKFYARFTSSFSQGSLVVGTVSSQDDPASFVALDTIGLDISWKEYSVIIHPSVGYNGTHKYIAIQHATLKNYQTIYLDDISIEDVPLCSVPFNLGLGTLTGTSGVVKWGSVHTSGSNFKIEYGPKGFTQSTGNGTYISNTASSTTISGLSPNTWYDFYVADNCDTNSLSSWAGPYSFKTECLGQLNGTYTIGGTVGSTNFATLDSAVSVLAGCGVSGPVIFNFQGGTYLTSIMLGTIQGGSSINTVTFNGGGVSVDTMAINAGITIVIEMDGTSYVTFQNLTIDGGGSSRVVWMHNNAHHIIFDNCHLIGTISTSSAYGVIVASESSTSIFSYGNAANYVSIKDCYLSGGYVGIALNGTSSAAFSSNNSIENTVIDNPGTYGMRLYYQEALTVTGCEIKNFGGTFAYGIYNYYARDFEFSGNKIFAPTYGIYISQGNRLFAPPSQSIISNNFVNANNSYGLYLFSTENVDILHNSIKGGSRGFYASGNTDSMDVRNNIIVGGTLEALYFSYSAYNTPFDFNIDYNIYHSTGTNIARWGTSNYLNLAAWQTGDTTRNVNSLQGDPIFVSATDFHILGTLPNDVADNNTTVVTDIDGDSRPMTGSTVKDIGADEYDVLDDDAQVIAILSPGDFTCGDSNIAVLVEFQSLGQDTITSMDVSVEVNGQTITATYTGSLANGEKDTITVGTFTQIAGATVSIKAFTELTGDQKSTNDTLIEDRKISDASMPSTFVTTDTICSGDSIGLYMTNPLTGVFMWLNSNNDTLGTADATDTLWVANVMANDTFRSVSQSQQFNVGKPDNSGIGSNYTFIMDLGLVFTVTKTITLDSVTVYPFTAGNVVVNLVSAGVVQQTVTTATTVTGNSPVQLYLGMVIPPGTYDLSAKGTSTGGMFRNSSGVTYPLNSPGSEISITNTMNNLASSGYYYFFYDWIISSGGCPRPDGMTSVNVMPSASASFNYTVGSPTVSNQTVNFDGSGSVADSLIWSFGDGTIDFGISPTHAYGTNGTWIVTLVAINACGSDTITDTIVTYGIGIDEGLIGETLTVYPNPNDGVFRVDFELEGLKDLEIRITDVTGKMVYSKDVGKASGAYRENIDISNYAKGMYLLQIKTNNVVVSRRVTIQ